ncbi:MAG: hypothetical protein DMD33_09175 [Gemmatimonadetes bacterium]|nr:MAG: hypothetical protein DMD33_09175 [Gemmatimonadota bacterium]PYO75740.1 MAG: hypothetical protein DMD67_10650 [Gemmatimonadota bacterium]
MATPVVRAALAAALLTDCLTGGWEGDDDSAGARDLQPQSARLVSSKYDLGIRKWPRRTR